jgi:hypothetical protein
VNTGVLNKTYDSEEGLFHIQANMVTDSKKANKFKYNNNTNKELKK